MTETTRTASLRITFIDAARGVAAFLVLFQHSYERFFPSLGEHLGSEVINFGQLGVVIFFLVSGFIIPFSLERSKSLGHFFVNRAFRIYPLYAFIILLQVLFVFLKIREIMPGSNFLKIGITHLFFAQEYFPSFSPWSENLVMGSWTLFIEAIWYLLFAGLFFLKISHRRILVISILGFLALTLLGLVFEKRLPMGRMGMLFNCIMGLHLYRRFIGQISFREFISGLMAGMGVLFFGLWVAFGHFESDAFNLQCVWTSWIVAYSVFGLFFLFRNKTLPLIEPALAFLGTISYSVYLLHFTILTLVLHFFNPNPLMFAGVLISVVLLSYFSYNWVERPAIDFGKRLLKKKKG